MKKIFGIVILMFVCLFMFSCTQNKDTHDYEAIDLVTQYIDFLPNKITLKNEEEVNEYYAMYNKLSDEDKALVENYSILENALKKIEYLKNEEEYIIIEYEKLAYTLKESLPDVVGNDVNTLAFPRTYDVKNDYASYLIYITWITDDPSTISPSNQTVSHGVIDKTVIITCTLTCTNTKESYTFTKDILVKKMELEDLSDQVVTAYFYGSYIEFSELDYKTLDMIVYCFAQIASRTVNGETEYYVDGSGLSSISKMVEARTHGVRVLFSLGGWHDDRNFWDTYKNCAASEEGRKQIANSILKFMEDNHLDGIDMDWEYPTSADRSNFTLLMTEIYNTLKAASPDYIVSAAIPSGTWISSNYNLKDLNNCLDYVNIMSYDLDGGSKTGHHTAYSDMVTGIEYMAKNGIDRSKIVCGAAFYGRKFNDVSSTNNGLNQSYSSKESIKFTDIYNNYLSRVGNGVTKYYDSNKHAYYLYDSENNVFISYDDAKSVQEKCQYSLTTGCGGVMFWSYNEDRTQTLMKAIYDYYHEANIK